MEDNTLQLIEKLKYNCHLGKHKHFNAADRFKRYDKAMSISIMLINLTIALAHLFTLNTEMSHWLVYSISGLSFLAVFIAGFELRSDYSKKFEGHRRIGNNYLGVARNCEKNIALFKDGKKSIYDSEKVIDELNKDYDEINKEAESFPTNQNDFNSAKQIQESKKTK